MLTGKIEVGIKNYISLFTGSNPDITTSSVQLFNLPPNYINPCCRTLSVVLPVINTNMYHDLWLIKESYFETSLILASGRLLGGHTRGHRNTRVIPSLSNSLPP